MFQTLMLCGLLAQQPPLNLPPEHQVPEEIKKVFEGTAFQKKGIGGPPGYVEHVCFGHRIDKILFTINADRDRFGGPWFIKSVTIHRSMSTPDKAWWGPVPELDHLRKKYAGKELTRANALEFYNDMIQYCFRGKWKK